MATNSKKENPKEEAVNAPAEEKLVTIKLPKERKDQEDKVVWINDRRFLIKRGVDVEVPESVALQIKHEEKMREELWAYEEKTRQD